MKVGLKNSYDFPFPCYLLQNTRVKIHFERRGNERGAGVEEQNEYNQEYWAEYFFSQIFILVSAVSRSSYLQTL